MITYSPKRLMREVLSLTTKAREVYSEPLSAESYLEVAEAADAAANLFPASASWLVRGIRTLSADLATAALYAEEGKRPAESALHFWERNLLNLERTAREWMERELEQ